MELPPDTFRRGEFDFGDAFFDVSDDANASAIELPWDGLCNIGFGASCQIRHIIPPASNGGLPIPSFKVSRKLYSRRIEVKLYIFLDFYKTISYVVGVSKFLDTINIVF